MNIVTPCSADGKDPWLEELYLHIIPPVYSKLAGKYSIIITKDSRQHQSSSFCHLFSFSEEPTERKNSVPV